MFSALYELLANTLETEIGFHPLVVFVDSLVSMMYSFMLNHSS
ncbi:hypothetical protein ABE871_17340 [Enterococcus gilvus]